MKTVMPLPPFRLLSACALVVFFSVSGLGSAGAGEGFFELKKDSRLVLLGNGLGSRMMAFGHFEATVQHRSPGKKVFIRNMCDEGNTPGFRPHSGRPSPWAFPGAEKYYR
ncbi:MAG: hypothetical protein AAF514_22520, partial [Verrucomicrobiota bacterium]